MRLTKKKSNTEVDDFFDKFPFNDKFAYKIISTNGKIEEVKTKDKKIIEYCKKLGLIE